MVVKTLLEYPIPRYGIIQYIDSDQDTHFTSKIIKLLCQIIRHSVGVSHPMTSTKLEESRKMNQTIKQQLAKLMIKTQMP